MSKIALELAKTTVVFILLAALAACSKPPQPDASTANQMQSPTGLERIPLADPTKYPPVRDMSGWQNPYLIVREDGIGFLDLSNREIHLLTQEEVPAELVALPLSAWPYGRVVLVAQVRPTNPSPETKVTLRKNRALLLGTLKELDVQFVETP